MLCNSVESTLNKEKTRMEMNYIYNEKYHDKVAHTYTGRQPYP